MGWELDGRLATEGAGLVTEGVEAALAAHGPRVLSWCSQERKGS